MFAPEPPADDLSTSRGVVLSRAATILRSIETQPLAGGSPPRGGDRQKRRRIALILVWGRAICRFCTGEKLGPNPPILGMYWGKDHLFRGRATVSIAITSGRSMHFTCTTCTTCTHPLTTLSQQSATRAARACMKHPFRQTVFSLPAH